VIYTESKLGPVMYVGGMEKC